jgi:hypothetical protein
LKAKRVRLIEQHRNVPSRKSIQRPGRLEMLLDVTP